MAWRKSDESQRSVPDHVLTGLQAACAVLGVRKPHCPQKMRRTKMSLMTTTSLKSWFGGRNRTLKRREQPLTLRNSPHHTSLRFP